jgi:xylulokinase
MRGVTILAHDIGTSGVKSSLVDASFREIDSQTSAYPTTYPNPEWAEQDPNRWWEGMVANSGTLVERQPDACARIGVIGLSGHMLGLVPVDTEGAPLTRAMIHSDGRAKDQFRRVQDTVGADRVYRTTGNILDPKAPLCKILWLAENEPEIFTQTVRFLQSKDFAAARLTGNIDTTDLSDASHAQLLDVRRGEYAADMLAHLGVPKEKLPAVHRGVDVIGRLTREAAEVTGLTQGIPVIAGGGDGACANAGAGIATPGDGYCNLGTTGWIATLMPEPHIDPERRLFNILSLDGETAGVFGTMQTAGRSLEWIRTILGIGDMNALERMIQRIAPGSEGLVFLPYLEGERSPVFDSAARGVFFGMSTTHGPAHMARAVMEGVTFGLRSILDAFRSFISIDEMPLIGGGANSPVWRQMIADILGVRLYSMDVKAENATSVGAAMAAAVGIGLYVSLPEAAACIGKKAVESPSPDPSPAYDRNYRTYTELYPRLRTLFTGEDDNG